MPPARPTPTATGQHWPTAPGTCGRARRAHARLINGLDEFIDRDRALFNLAPRPTDA